VKRFAVAAALVLAVLDPAAALAAVKGPHESTPLNLPSSQQPQQLAASGGGSGSLVRTFVGLAIVVGAIYGVYWVLRQVKKSREERALGSGLHTEAVVPLGPNRSLHLVRAGRELVLVGVAEQGVVPIRTYTEAEAIAAGLIGAGAPDRDDDAGTPAPASGPARAGLPGLNAAARLTDLFETLRQRTVRG
jgi:flagellar protein FliO/FliZ